MASLSTQNRSHSATYTTTTNKKKQNKRQPNSLPSRSTSFQQQPSSSNCKPHSHHQSQTPRTPTATPQTNPNYLLVDQINRHHDLYLVLGLSGYSALNRHSIKLDDIRKAYISRSRLCHPDKLPQYEPCTAAFQKLSFAYETLSNPHTRKLYDSNQNRSPHAFNFDNSSSSSSSKFRNPTSNNYNGGGGGSNKSNPNPKTDSNTNSSSYSSSTNGQHINPDETLNGVLHATFCEFMDGDFEMIRVVINALNEGNPGLNLGEEMIESLEKTFARLRRVLISGQKYLGVVRYEMLELWDLQAKLRGMSYFNLVGRMRVSLAIARVTLLIPMRIDQALRDGSLSTRVSSSSSAEDIHHQEEQDSGEESEEDRLDDDRLGHSGSNKSPRNGLLPPKIAGLLQATVAVLERGERATLWPYSSSSSSVEPPSPSPSSSSFSSSSSSSSTSSSTTTTTTISPTTTTSTLPVSPSHFDSSSSAASSPSSPSPSSSSSSSSSNTTTATTSTQIPHLPPVHILPSLVHTPPNPPPVPASSSSSSLLFTFLF